MTNPLSNSEPALLLKTMEDALLDETKVWHSYKNPSIQWLIKNRLLDHDLPFAHLCLTSPLGISTFLKC